MFTSRPAIAVKFPKAALGAPLFFVVMAAVGKISTSRWAQSVMDPLVTVMALYTFISFPAYATRLPLVAVIAEFTTTFRRAIKFRVDKVVPLVQVIAAFTLISPLPLPEAFAVLIVTLVPAVRAVTRVPVARLLTLAVSALGFGVKTPPLHTPPVSTPAEPEIVTSAGSSSQVPLLPFVALALTLMPATSSQWP